MALYTVTNYSVSTILGWISSGEIAIPEIQRPFVWKTSKVRDLVDSLYWGYPVGYLIVWRDPTVKLKDGTLSAGKKILIDGQQRVTALQAAISGMEVVGEDYQQKRICISFNPQTEKFEVLNSAIRKTPAWIPDISVLFKDGFSTYTFVNNYCQLNDLIGQEDLIDNRLRKVRSIADLHLGSIELADSLDIERVTEIFIRINSKGVPLTQYDFAMSKIAADKSYGGPGIRKSIDYFCHILEVPEALKSFDENDSAFMRSPEGKSIRWAVNKNQDLFLPKYEDVLRVAFTFKFGLGKLAILVGKLSGRNYEQRTYDEETAAAAFADLKDGVAAFVNETNFRRFIMIIQSAGFIKAPMLSSRIAVGFAYSLYLYLKERKTPPAEIESIVRRWLVMSLLTDRYTASSSESQIDSDIRKFRAAESAKTVLETEERICLGKEFWELSMPERLKSAYRTCSAFSVFLAAQVKSGTKGFLSSDITVSQMLSQDGDIHHLFPKKYLKDRGFPQSLYNQVANYALTQSEINIAIKDRAPCEYMDAVRQQIETGIPKLGGILDKALLAENLSSQAIPEGFAEMDFSRYEDFLEQRRKLMVETICRYYEAL